MTTTIDQAKATASEKIDHFINTLGVEKAQEGWSQENIQLAIKRRCNVAVLMADEKELIQKIWAENKPELSDAARELELYFDNEQWLAKPAWIAIGKAHKKGPSVFSYETALKYLTNRCREAAKQYALEHGSMTQGWQQMFPMADRKAAAESILEGMLAEFRLGNYWS